VTNYFIRAGSYIIIGRRTVGREGVGDIVAPAYHRAIGCKLEPSRAAVEEDRVRQIQTTQLGDGRVTVSVAEYLHKRLTAIAVGLLSGRTETNYMYIFIQRTVQTHTHTHTHTQVLLHLSHGQTVPVGVYDLTTLYLRYQCFI